MSDLTHVELLWLEKRIENWIRFGHAAEEQILDKRRRILSFAPGSIFAFVRWTSNDFGTVISRIDILRAVAPGQRCATVPYVRPGGEHPVAARQAGPRSNACCRLSTPSRRSASTRPTRPRTIGTTSTTVCPSTKCRARTRARAIRPGCIGGGSRRDGPRGDTPDGAGGRDCCAVDDRGETGPPVSMERFRKRAHRPLPVAADRPTCSSPNLSRSEPPEPLATFLADGRYLPRGIPMLKRVLALPGQTVCRDELTITVDKI